MKFAPIFMKFGTQETSDMLIILLYVEWKTQRKKFSKNWFQTWNMHNVYEIINFV